MGISTEDEGLEGSEYPGSREGGRPGSINNGGVEELQGEALLKTIKVPTNLANLSSRLPKSNYQRTRSDEISLASLAVTKE